MSIRCKLGVTLIFYDEPLIRPPAEANSLIFQATIGCSHNKCAFCVTYKNKKFRARPEADLFKEIQWAANVYPETTRIFLGDGDALALSQNKLIRILKKLSDSFSKLKRVSAYASPGNFKNKSVADLERLKNEGLTLVYVGFESGDDEVLSRINKGFCHDEMAKLCLKPGEAGMKMSAMIILGLGGPRLSMRHASESARLINTVKPRFASALSLMLPPMKPSYQEVYNDPTWRLLSPDELLLELRHLVQGVTADGIIFRSNHASNYLALAGTFQKSKDNMIKQIDAAISNPAMLRPEFLRGL